MDSEYSRHMIRDECKFTFLIKKYIYKKKSDYVTFGDNAKGGMIGQINVGNSTYSLIENMLLVDGLKYNHLSINQLCDKSFYFYF